ncbi:hypothetical protein PENSPDRAFT_752599 [Peniophora sp. CONT]|nr:hypothetical protein PENSPDRAFT_752599 [Peniophora sp. CONT]
MLRFHVLSFGFWLIWCCVYAPGAIAQDFTVPQNWLSTIVNTDSNLTRTQREGLASGTAHTLVGNVDLSTGSIGVLDAVTTASLASVLALQDYYSGNTTWRDQVLEGTLSKYSTQHPTYADGYQYGTWSPDTLHFGLAAYYAYRTYNDSTALQLSITNWQLAYASFMTTQRAEAGTLPGASNFTSNCSPKLAGGVFTQPPIGTDAEIATDSSGMMISLSGYLFNVTRNATYLDAAELAWHFMQENAYQPGNPILAGVDASDCAPLDTRIYTWNTGLYLQGTAVLASITGNDSYQTVLKDLVEVGANASWTSTEDGRITEYFTGSASEGISATFSAYKGLYIRALAEAARLNPGTPMADYIRSYITVQLHAITQSANTEGTNFYSTTWNGPPATSFDALGAIAALDVLNPTSSYLSAGGVSSTTIPTPSSTKAPSAGQTSVAPSKRSFVGVGGIVGGVVGGMAGCVAMALAMFFMRKRKRRSSAVDTSVDASGRMQPGMVDLQPFMLDRPSEIAVGRLYKGEAMASHTGNMSISAPISSQAPSAPVSDITTDALVAPARRGTNDEVEAVLSDFANRIQAMLHMRHRETDEQPPQYTAS